MEESDDFTYYPGFVSLMEAQADYVQNKWMLGFDANMRQEYISQIPNIQCRVSLPSYFYIPAELYYNFGPLLADQIIENGDMEALNSALFRYVNDGLETLPTSEQIYDPNKFFTDERYENVSIENLEIEGEKYLLIDEGNVGSLDLVYLMQDKIGQENAINAAVSSTVIIDELFGLLVINSFWMSLRAVLMKASFSKSPWCCFSDFKVGI